MTEIILQQKRWGTVDTLNGVIAFASKKLHEKIREPAGFTSLEFTNGIHALQMDPELCEVFRHVDFRKIGDDYYSSALEDFLFISGVWADHQQIGLNKFYFSPKRYEQEMQTLEKEFSPEALARLELMADRFIANIPRYQSITV